jgi:hypothetical protein
MRTASGVKIGGWGTGQSVGHRAGDEGFAEAGACQRPHGLTGLRHISVGIDQRSDIGGFDVGCAGDDHSTVRLADQNQIARKCPDRLDCLVNVKCEIGCWGWNLAETGKSERLGLVASCNEQICDFFESPTALPPPGIKMNVAISAPVFRTPSKMHAAVDPT